MDTVKFTSFEITNDTVRPCRKYLDAIRDFPTPANITDVRSWFGLINQASYAFAATERMLPFRQLLKPGAPFVSDNLNNQFEESKSLIIDEIEEGIRIFDKSKSHMQLNPATPQLRGRPLPMPFTKPDSLSLAAVT